MGQEAANQLCQEEPAMTSPDQRRMLERTYKIYRDNGGIARYYQMFREGKIVVFSIENGLPASWMDARTEDPVRMFPTGQFQLRFFSKTRPDWYGVWARMDGSMEESDWAPVDGPWTVGENGPFNIPVGRRDG